MSFWRKNQNIPDEIEMVLELNDGETINYKVPTIRYGEYDIIELCERNTVCVVAVICDKIEEGV